MSVDVKSIFLSSKMDALLSSKASAVAPSSFLKNIQIAGIEQILPALIEVAANSEDQKLIKFSKNQPTILFTCDYIVDGKFVGALLVFERYINATHYEIFKQNKFDNDPQFQRILFLNTDPLTEETKQFIPYVKDILGFDIDETSAFIVLDDNIKKDRMYEYFVRATFVPFDVEQLNFSLILESKNLTKTIDVGRGQTITSLSFSLLLSTQLAWIISLLNEKVPFFGRAGIEFIVYDVQKTILLPKNNDDLMTMIKDSIYLFGAKNVLSKLVNLLFGFEGKTGILNEQMMKIFVDSIDEKSGGFSVDYFNAQAKLVSNTFKLFFDISTSSDLQKKQQFATAGVVLPNVFGIISFNDLQNLSKILDFIRIADYAITYVQENFDKLTAIDQSATDTTTASTATTATDQSTATDTTTATEQSSTAVTTTTASTATTVLQQSTRSPTF